MSEKRVLYVVVGIHMVDEVALLDGWTNALRTQFPEIEVQIELYVEPEIRTSLHAGVDMEYTEHQLARPMATPDSGNESTFQTSRRLQFRPVYDNTRRAPMSGPFVRVGVIGETNSGKSILTEWLKKNVAIGPVRNVETYQLFGDKNVLEVHQKHCEEFLRNICANLKVRFKVVSLRNTTPLDKYFS